MDTYCLVCNYTRFYVFEFEDINVAICYQCNHAYKADVKYGELSFLVKSQADRLYGEATKVLILDDSMVRTMKMLLHTKTLIEMAANIR